MKKQTVTSEQVTRLWLRQQGLLDVQSPRRLTRRSFSTFLETTGGLQLDSINVVERAHYLTLWSRFGNFRRDTVDRWIYDDKLAYEYWGHEATILPIAHLPIGKRRMLRFPPPSFKNASWWKHYAVAPAIKKHVLKQLRMRGPLESTEFSRAANVRASTDSQWTLPKEENRALKLLWHSGRIGIAGRRHFRQVFDLSENVYPNVKAASTSDYFESWLLAGLRGNGISSEKHLDNYYTSPKLTAHERAEVLRRCVKRGDVREVNVEGSHTTWYALPEHMEALSLLNEPVGTTILSPFDSFLWQRKRAQDLLDFHYRVEIYVPKAKRQFGYYAMPILHNGRLVGRIDPKLHRDRRVLELASISLETGFERSGEFEIGFRESLERLADFVGATDLEVPSGW